MKNWKNKKCSESNTKKNRESLKLMKIEYLYKCNNYIYRCISV